MKFKDFEAGRQAARDQLRSFEGNNDWPGLTAHDRVYALPVDYQNEAYTAIVRAQAFYDHESCPINIEIWHWHWRGSQEGTIEKLSADQLVALAGIKREVRRWLNGEIDELPPSTCLHLSHHIR